MSITITPTQVAQTAAYTQAERRIRQLITNGLNLQLKAIEAREQLETKLASGGDLEEMSAYYTAQYSRLGGDAAEAFDAIEARIVANHQQMWKMHSALQTVEPGTDLFPGLPEYTPEE